MTEAGDFELGGLRVATGSRALVRLPVARIPTGQVLDVPVHVLHGTRPGPTAFVSAALHGDELNGIAAIRHLLLGIDAGELCGTLLAVPVINGFGLLHTSRYLPDRRDLNRSFPGSARGSLTARLAHLFLNEVVRRCDFGVDLHTGSGGRANLPQVRCDFGDTDALQLATAFGGPLILHSQLRPGSLRGAAHKVGTSVIVHEAGEAHRLNRVPVGAAVEGVMRVLRARNLLGPRPDAPAAAEPRRARRSTWVRAGQSGVCEMIAALGDRVNTGDEIAVVYDPSSMQEQVVRCKMSGLVIGLQRETLVYRGDALVHVAELD